MMKGVYVVTQFEMDKLMELVETVRKVPTVSSVVTDVSIYRVGVKDCEYALQKVSDFLTTFCTYQRWKGKLNTGDVDDEFILECKNNYEKALEDMKSFIDTRSKEAWQ